MAAKNCAIDERLTISDAGKRRDPRINHFSRCIQKPHFDLSQPVGHSFITRETEGARLVVWYETT